MKKQYFTKSAAIFISLLMLVISAFPVYADSTVSTIDTSKTGTLTIYKLKENDGNVKQGNGQVDSSLTNEGMQGIEFTAVKIADIVSVTENGVVGTYFANVDSGLLSLLTAHGCAPAAKTMNGTAYYTSGALQDAITSMNQVTGTTPGSEKLISYLSTKSGSVVFPLTDADGKAEKTGLSLGLYLVGETSAEEYLANGDTDDDVNTNTSSKEVIYSPATPFLVMLPMTNQDAIDGNAAETAWQYNVTVYPKNQTVAIPKYIVKESDNDTLVLSEDFEIGEKVRQVIAPSAPAVIDGHNYEKYVIKDTMDDGLAFIEVEEVRFGAKVANPESKSDFASFTVLEEGKHYKVEAATDKKSFEVIFLADGLALLNSDHENAQVAVIFTSYVTKDAHDGDGEANRNKPQLTWKNANTIEASVEGNQPEVYTYRLELTKTGLTDAANAVFSVTRSAGTTLSFVQEESGLYHLFDNTRDAAEDAVSTVSPKSDGSLVIRGLDTDTYTFTEIATEEDKSLLKSSFAITLEGNDPADGNLKSAKVTIDGEESALTRVLGTASMTVENYPAIILRTGGAGRGIFLYSALGFLLISVLSAAVSGKKQNRNVSIR